MHINNDALYFLVGAIIVQAVKDSAGTGAFMQTGDQQSGTAFLDEMELPHHIRDRIVAAELDRRRTTYKPVVQGSITKQQHSTLAAHNRRSWWGSWWASPR